MFNLLLTSNYSKHGYSEAYTAFVASGFKWGKFWLWGKLTPDHYLEKTLVGLGQSTKIGKHDLSWEALYFKNEKGDFDYS